MSRKRQPEPAISIVCVYNDSTVRRGCLDRSIEGYTGPVVVDYIPVDNTSHAFPTAGAALNHGARRAKHDVVVFVHQDVYLHSIDRLCAIGSELRGDNWGVLGASGVSPFSENVGRLRDRVLLIGADAESPVEVDSVDEVLFMVRRDRVLEHPLSEDLDLAWHAYGVEYGLRIRNLGLRVGAANLAITHNSLTINLDRLDEAHRRIAEQYPHQLPLWTSCGLIGVRPSTWRDAPVLRNHRWRIRWIQKSLRAIGVSRQLGVPVVFSDIENDVDLLGFSNEAPLHVVNIDKEGGFAEHCADGLQLFRRGRPVVAWATGDLSGAVAILDGLPRSDSTLVTGLDSSDLVEVRRRFELDSTRQLAGLQRTTLWLLGGPVLENLPVEWSSRRAVPLGSSWLNPQPLTPA